MNAASSEAGLVQRYQKRLTSSFEIREYPDSKPLLLSKKNALQRFVVLDERGCAYTSAKFAALLQDWQAQAMREVHFFIGGADGHSDATRRASDVLLSFGPATWPHMLVRVLLLEQLYRAQSILLGHPYHRAGT
jgi:23S rRNA (pseudouridine1915-N3)-methyltransferase